MPTRAAAIGAVVGLLLFTVPRAVGGGDDLSQSILSAGPITIAAVLALLALRMLTGPLSYAAGTPGGLFAPLLAAGALWGLLWAEIMAVIVPGTDVRAAAAIVGMSALFAASVRAPFTGVVLVIEMTAATSVAVPMIAAAGCAALTAHLLGSKPIYDSLRDRMLAAQR